MFYDIFQINNGSSDGSFFFPASSYINPQNLNLLYLLVWTIIYRYTTIILHSNDTSSSNDSLKSNDALDSNDALIRMMLWFEWCFDSNDV